MGKTAGELRIKVTAGTAELVMELAKADTVVKKFARGVSDSGTELKKVGHEGPSQIQAVSGAIRVLEGGITNNLRAAERFTASVLGLGPILQRAFPLVGAIAFTGILVKMGTDAYEVFKELSQGAEKTAAGFAIMNASIQLQGDQLDLSNSKLEATLAKLEGRRQNTLAIMLGEAKVMADQLVASIINVSSQIDKTFKESELTGFSGFISKMTMNVNSEVMDRAKKYMVGETGTGGARGDARAEEQDWRNKIDKAIQGGAGEAEVSALLAKMQNAMKTSILQQRLFIDSLIEDVQETWGATNKANPRLKTRVIEDSESWRGPAYKASMERQFQNTKPTFDALNSIKQTLEREGLDINVRIKELGLNTAISKKQADNEAASLESPYKNELAKARSDVQQALAKLEAASGNASARMEAEATAETIKSLQQINQTQQQKNKNIPDVTLESEQGQDLLAEKRHKVEAEFAAQTVTADRKNIDNINVQIAKYKLLNAAIGEGYAAVRKASAQVEAITKFGADRYADASLMATKKAQAEFEKLVQASETEQGFAQIGDLKKLNDELSTQLELQQSIADAEHLSGGEAGKWAALSHQIAEVNKTYGGTEGSLERILLLTRKVNADRNQAATKRTDVANEEYNSYKLLEAAQTKGPKTARAAVFENQLSDKRRRDGMSEEEESALRKTHIAALEVEIGESVEKRVYLYSAELEKLSDEKAYLESNLSDYTNILGLERARRDINNAIYQTQVKQLLAVGNMSSGIKAFFVEMQYSAKLTSDIIKDALTSSVDKFSDSLSKAMTGQKAAWGAMFKSVGDAMVKDVVKSTLEGQLVKLGQSGKLGKGIQGSLASLIAPDGSTTRPFWVRLWGAVGAIGPAGYPTTGSPSWRNSPLSGNPRITRPDGLAGGIMGAGVDTVAGRDVYGPSRPTLSIPVGHSGGIAPDGTDANPFYVIVKAIAGGVPPPSTASKAFSTAGSIASTIGTILGMGVSLGGGTSSGGTPNVSSEITYGGIAGARAGGGSVNAGSAYLVGERGMETFVPESSGMVYSNATSRRMFSGDQHTYNIDARGTDPLQTEQRVRVAIMAAHTDAVTKSVLIRQEQLRRSPRSM